VYESDSLLGFYQFQSPPRKRLTLPAFVGNAVAIDYPKVEYLFHHLGHAFPALNLKGWRGLVECKLSQKVIERLRYLGNTAKLKHCPDC